MVLANTECREIERLGVILRFILTVLLGCILNNAAFGKELALTFDDSPNLASPYLGVKNRALRIQQALKKHDVREALFFATPRNNKASTLRILKSHVSNGHLLANHSFSHKRYSNTANDVYFNDIMKADKVLAKLKGFVPYFRFPFLDAGKRREKIDEARKFLKAKNYRHGYVTIDNSEWVIEGELKKALKLGKKFDLEKMKKIFVDHLVAQANYTEALGNRYVAKNIKHTLLLHENEVAGLFLDDLLSALKQDGWKIISAIDAYADPIAKRIPKTIRLGQGRVVALAIDRGYKGEMNAPNENEKSIRKRIEEQNIFKGNRS